MAVSINKRRKSVGRAGGFTLIEVLASIVLVALIIPVAMKGVSLATVLASDSKSKLEALELAQIRLSEIMLNREWQNGTMTALFDDEYKKYRWTMETTDLTEAGVKQVDVTVEWESRGYKRYVRLTTLAFNETAAL